MFECTQKPILSKFLRISIVQKANKYVQVIKLQKNPKCLRKKKKYDTSGTDYDTFIKFLTQTILE